MKKLNFIFGTTLVLASALSVATNLNIGVNQEKVTNDTLALKEGQQKAIFTEAKEELVEEADGLYLAVRGNVDVNELKAQKNCEPNNVSLTITHNDNMIKAPVTIKDGTFSAKISFDGVNHLTDWYDVRLAKTDDNTELMWFNNKTLVNNDHVIFDKKTGLFIRLFNAADGGKIQPLNGYMNSIDYVEKEGKVFARFSGPANANAKATLNVQIDKVFNWDIPFSFNKEKNEIECFVDMTDIPNDRKVRIEVKDSTGLINGEITKDDSLKDSQLYQRNLHGRISKDGIIYDIASDAGNWYKLLKTTEPWRLSRVDVNKDTSIRFSGIINTKIATKKLHIGLVLLDRDNNAIESNVIKSDLIKLDAQNKFDLVIKHDFMTLKDYTKYEIRLLEETEDGSLKNINIDGQDRVVPSYDEYLNREFHNVKAVDNDVIVKGCHTKDWKIGIAIEKNWAYTDGFRDCALNSEVGFKYKFAKSKALDTYLYNTFTDATMFLDFVVPEYIKNSHMQDEFGIMITTDVKTDVGEFYEIPAGTILKKADLTTAKVKDTWTVKLTDINLETSIHTEIKFAPYFKMGNKYCLGKRTVASFYSTLVEQIKTEEMEMNKGAMQHLIDTYKIA